MSGADNNGMSGNNDNQAMLTFADLEERYGKAMAYDLLLTIEKLAKIQDELAKAVSSHDERLQRAMGRLEDVNFSTMQ